MLRIGVLLDMPIEMIAWMVLGLLAVVALHELTHVVIAKAHGHETVCIAVNPVGVAVVFEDTPSPSYWSWQVILPMIVTAVVSYAWLFVLVTYPSELQPSFATRGVLEQLPIICVIMAFLTSGGDVLGLVLESRHPVWGEDRILRDLRILRKLPSIVRFTDYGRRRWLAAWHELGEPAIDTSIAVVVAD